MQAEVLAYYRAHPNERGYRTIANRLRQQRGLAVIGQNKVGEIIAYDFDHILNPYSQPLDIHRILRYNQNIPKRAKYV